MASKYRIPPLLATLAAVLAVVTFFTVGIFAGGSAGGTLATGRSVAVQSDSAFLSASFSGDTATVKAGRKSIVVQPQALLIDGMNVGTIDEAVRDVQINVKGRTITFVADGQVVPTTAR